MHLAIIPDGNRRWAKERGFSSSYGHKRGVGVLLELMEWIDKYDEIDEVSIFLLSTENITKRSATEISTLLNLAGKYFEKVYKKWSQKYYIIVHYSKDILMKRQDLKDKIAEMVNKLESFKEKYPFRGQSKKINLLLGYGSRKEIVEAAKNFNGTSEEEFIENLWVKRDVDILIRTGKETRISNFLLFQSAYAEIFFIDKYWPEFTEDDLREIIDSFKKKERRFGR